MQPRSLALFIGLAALATAPASAAPGPQKGAYVCVNLGGNAIAGRKFSMDGDGTYGPAGGDTGSYRVQGRNVYFRGGALDGHQALQLPNGRLRLSRKIFCEMVEAAPEPQPEAPPPEPAAPPAPPPAKLIKVKPGAH